MSREIKMYYNREDRQYYIYDGEEYISDTPDLSVALMFFISLVTDSITISTEHFHDHIERIEQYGVSRVIHSAPNYGYEPREGE